MSQASSPSPSSAFPVSSLVSRFIIIFAKYSDCSLDTLGLLLFPVPVDACRSLLLGHFNTAEERELLDLDPLFFRLGVSFLTNTLLPPHGVVFEDPRPLIIPLAVADSASPVILAPKASRLSEAERLSSPVDRD